MRVPRRETQKEKSACFPPTSAKYTEKGLLLLDSLCEEIFQKSYSKLFKILFACNSIR